MSSPTNPSKYQLTRIPDARHRSDRDPPTTFRPDEREEESEDDGEEGDSGVLVELGGHDDHGYDGGD